MKKAGHSVEIIYMCGGLSKNSLYVETHANVLGLPVVLPQEEESVLVGSAVLGASASKDFSTIQDAMLSMCGEGTVTEPSKSEAEFHDKKYQVFRKMVEDQKQYRAIMNGWNWHQNDVVYWEYRAFISCLITTLMHLTTGSANQLLLETSYCRFTCT